MELYKGKRRQNQESVSKERLAKNITEFKQHKSMDQKLYKVLRRTNEKSVSRCLMVKFQSIKDIEQILEGTEERDYERTRLSPETTQPGS